MGVSLSGRALPSHVYFSTRSPPVNSCFIGGVLVVELAGNGWFGVGYSPSRAQSLATQEATNYGREKHQRGRRDVGDKLKPTSVTYGRAKYSNGQSSGWDTRFKDVERYRQIATFSPDMSKGSAFLKPQRNGKFLLPPSRRVAVTCNPQSICLTDDVMSLPISLDPRPHPAKGMPRCTVLVWGRRS
jgi:hypothetical protein